MLVHAGIIYFLYNNPSESNSFYSKTQCLNFCSAMQCSLPFHSMDISGETKNGCP